LPPPAEHMNDQFVMIPKGRKEAIALGVDRFFSGIPCKRGHLAPRYVSTGNCAACQLEHARRHGGWKARPSRATYLDQLRSFIEQRGGVLLSNEYVAARTKVKVRCAARHEFGVTPDNLKRGRWCPECKRQKHLERLAQDFWSVERLREFARERHGGDCLATTPAPMLSKVSWKCTNDEHPAFPAVIAKMVHSGQWCAVCWQERRQPPNPAISFDRVVEVVRGRGGEIIRVGKDGIWKGSKTLLVVRCPNGHSGPVQASNLLYARSWCPECLNKGERIVRAIFERTFGGTFPKSKPKWLVSQRGRKLELDGYNEQLQIAFEYQGPHHFFVDYVIAHDKIKREACTARNVRLVEVEAVKKPHPPENVLAKVAEAFHHYGITEAPQLPSGDIFFAELNDLRELARKKGGRLVSERYLGSEPHEWHCGVAEHPNWRAEAWRIRNGKWCAACAGNRKLGIAGLRSWGNALGLELLATKYRGGTLCVYRWRCHKHGHVIERSRTNILQSVSRGIGPCTVCAGTRK